METICLELHSDSYDLAFSFIELVLYDKFFVSNFVCYLQMKKAGLVGLVVFRDIGLVGGAVYKRILMMNWKASCLSCYSLLNKFEANMLHSLILQKLFSGIVGPSSSI